MVLEKALSSMLNQPLDLYPSMKQQLVPSPLLLLPMPSVRGKPYLKRVMGKQDKPIFLCALPLPFLGSKSKRLPQFIFVQGCRPTTYL